jgi:ATP-dependent Zn protease
MWQGSGPQNVRDLFARARRYAPSIVFIDEIDAVGRARAGLPGGTAEETTLNALLTEMDGFVSGPAARPVFLLAATNFQVEAESEGRHSLPARTLDPALVRRFDRVILVDLPDRSARLAFLSSQLLGRPNCAASRDLVERLAGRTTGMSIAGLEGIVSSAARAAAKASVAISDALLEEAFESVRHGDVRAWAPDLLERTARHEAGHTVMYWLSGWWPTYVTVVARSQHGGYMERDPDEASRQLRTRGDVLAGIRMALGGRAAELLHYAADGLSTGASADLRVATRAAREMIATHGMDDALGPVAADVLLSAPGAGTGALGIQITETVAGMLKAEMARTIDLLQANRPHLECVARALVEKNRLTRSDLQELLPEAPSPRASVAPA